MGGAANLVAPFTGAWIETIQKKQEEARVNVAPFTGAWIETYKRISRELAQAGRALHGRVD